jgi:hypothetical protein
MSAKPYLVDVVSELKSVLAERAGGSAKSWLRRVESCLVRIERAARQHRDAFGDSEEKMVAVDTPLNPSPTVARRTEALRQELEALLHETARLREKTQTVSADPAPINPFAAAGALPVAPEAAEIADFGAFCERLERLLGDFEQFDRTETDLIQDSVTLDLGAGD